MFSSASMPLIVLLGRAHDALESELDARLREQTDFPGLSIAHTRNVLRHLDVHECSRASQLVERSGISKQALSLQIAHLEKAGYVVTSQDPGDRRARRVELTPLGTAAREAVQRIMGELDAEWNERWGGGGGNSWQAVRERLDAIIEFGERAS